ncbi:queuine tRNA-ribosyltransferase accessory subunit 2 isoform X1 [Sarcophilus harrisii]|uniref:Queuine tRNA-ribosyltransferase accessory subunit 2 n=2 Tax=Sarcophilus harrisii TaxID=9305 RepID=A0A7N4PM82_SARHA|nr:queuine tRNA-ribosyltransferase accessory subunit 2 isoform X1 [Sarcophilus harrisii]XP_031815545.1 queuine tRNA-ribosyltransferase accessory subunit 2 isoform X1 [Sarcophilus harrisii]
MKLNLSRVVRGCRLGTLNNLGKKGDRTMEFPGCLLYTRTGSAPHLTHDTLQVISGIPVMTQLTLSSLAEHYEILEEYKEGIGKFIGMPESVFYCSLHDPVNTCPPGYVTNKSVSVWGVGGRLEMTAAKFMTIQQALQPDWFQCLSDGEALCGEVFSAKRARKSVDRSLAFLDECLKLQEQSEVLRSCVMIGVIEGGDIREERLRSARETAKRPVGGFLLDGFHGDAMTKETKLQLMSSVTAELPEDKPRLIFGIGQPDEVLECIEAGVDLFESFFPYQVTERGCALTFSFDYQPNPEDTVLQQNGKKKEGGDNRDHIDKVTTIKCIPETAFEINLKEKKYRDDFGPLVEGCSCYCCKNHSRAYVHHLLVTNELLAGVLLMMHNFQHYFGFFCAIREALRKDRLGQLKELICKQATS